MIVLLVRAVVSAFVAVAVVVVSSCKDWTNITTIGSVLTVVCVLPWNPISVSVSSPQKMSEGRVT